MQDLPKLHRNYSSGAIIWGSFHPTEENILLLRHNNIYNHTPVTTALRAAGGYVSAVPRRESYYFVNPPSILDNKSFGNFLLSAPRPPPLQIRAKFAQNSGGGLYPIIRCVQNILCTFLRRAPPPLKKVQICLHWFFFFLQDEGLTTLVT